MVSNAITWPEEIFGMIIEAKCSIKASWDGFQVTLGQTRCWFTNLLNMYQIWHIYHDVRRIRYIDGSWNFNWDLVKALKRSFANLAMGSEFKHGSDKDASGKFNSMMIAIISQLGNKSNLNIFGLNNEFLHRISIKPRKHSALQASDIVTKIKISQPGSHY